VSKNKKKFDLKASLDQWDEEETLKNLSLFLDKVEGLVKFIESEEGAITHSMIVLKCGDKILCSDPYEFEWPLQRMPIPESLKGLVN